MYEIETINKCDNNVKNTETIDFLYEIDDVIKVLNIKLSYQIIILRDFSNF